MGCYLAPGRLLSSGGSAGRLGEGVLLAVFPVSRGIQLRQAVVSGDNQRGSWMVASPAFWRPRVTAVHEIQKRVEDSSISLGGNHLYR